MKVIARGLVKQTSETRVGQQRRSLPQGQGYHIKPTCRGYLLAGALISCCLAKDKQTKVASTDTLLEGVAEPAHKGCARISKPSPLATVHGGDHHRRRGCGIQKVSAKKWSWCIHSNIHSYCLRTKSWLHKTGSHFVAEGARILAPSTTLLLKFALTSTRKFFCLLVCWCLSRSD